MSVPKEYTQILELIKGLIGNTTTYQSQLDNIAKKIFGNRYKGSFSSDQIPKLENDECCIANLDDSSKPGSHWISLYKKNNDIYVYDSFGRSSKKIIPSVFKSGNGTIKDTDYDSEQKINENNCGQRSLAWLCYLEEYGVKKALKI